MTDQNTDRQPGDVPLEEERRSIWDKVSIIWLIPIIALAIALFAAWRNYSGRGPVIEIAFENAAGITADETELRYRDIGVGIVEDVGFENGLGQVVVSVRVEQDIAEYIDQDARFWVVRPEVSARGVSGLDTVLSGVYIEGAWDSEPGTRASRFDGLAAEPLIGNEADGIEFELASEDGLPTSKTPIIYKGVEVGMVDAAEIEAGGAGVRADAVIYSDYADLVTTQTRFWDISGFSFSLGASGARLNFSSFASLISGGVTFETLSSGGEPLTRGAEYELFPDEDSAREDFLVEGDGATVDVAMVFENISGLSTGAAVELGGLRVGDVASLTGIVDEERFGDSEVRLLVTARLNPGRIGLAEGASAETLFDYLDGRIAEGLRARLTNASILTGGLKVELAEVDDAETATVDRSGEPYPLIPTADAQITDVTATAQGALQRVSDLPIEEVMQSAIGLMNQATTLIGNQDLQDTPGELRGILSAVRGIAESQETQGIPDQVSALIADLQETSDSLNAIVARLQEEDTIGELTQAIATVGTAAETLPGLLTEAQSLVENANSVPLQDLSDQISTLLTSARTVLNETGTLIASEDVQGVPSDVRGLLASARGLLGSDEAQQLPSEVTALLNELQATSASLNRVVTQVEEEGTVQTLQQAVASIGEATDRLPLLLDEARSVVSEAGDVPFEAISAQVSDLLRAAETLLTETETLIASEDVQGVPTELRGILSSARGVVDSEEVQGLPTQVGGLVTELQGASTTLNDLLAQIQTEDAVGKVIRAVEDVEAAAQGLPDIVEEARGIVENAGEVQIEVLADQVSDLVASTNAFIDQESTRALPGELNAALADLQATLTELREGGLVENANATLASARDAARAIEEASRTLPALSAQLQTLADQAGATLGTYGENAPFTRDTQAAIRQVNEAAEAVERLANTIERNPNSLILGR
ncbi:paraquat-inducible protein B [Roseivivax halodurans JCM 10272]|uniref:Paraquat-inducible protein B n=1 Tax=Roseivivax halodurans JCM 10272 TaxID=1449350 RepID=X7EJF7_9RHOB|nr:MlaD family protein [Roseivivax halodurans]ETX15291.1 paraquat-inducible protein B [Roseivivax halodurans JCM 10272]